MLLLFGYSITLNECRGQKNNKSLLLKLVIHYWLNQRRITIFSVLTTTPILLLCVEKMLFPYKYTSFRFIRQQRPELIIIVCINQILLWPAANFQLHPLLLTLQKDNFAFLRQASAHKIDYQKKSSTSASVKCSQLKRCASRRLTPLAMPWISSLCAINSSMSSFRWLALGSSIFDVPSPIRLRLRGACTSVVRMNG